MKDEIGFFTEILLKKEKIIGIVKLFSPIILLLGFFHQFIILVYFDKLQLFSWSQVINDTAMLIIPSFFIVIGLFVGYFPLNIFNNELNKLKIKGKNIIKPYFSGIFLIVLIFGCFSYIFSEWSYKFIGSYFISGLLFGIIPVFFKNKINSEKLKYIFILISLFLILIISNLGSTWYIKDLNIEVKGNKEQILYFNDKYIITETKIIKNNDDIIINYTNK